ncbi:hypothetical protein ACO34A_10055 [Rhizobium sp. ACO-34A]|nr:hypothetical protein ACO34A_10055 [Rhizobium sp. ACO-34A]
MWFQYLARQCEIIGNDIPLPCLLRLVYISANFLPRRPEKSGSNPVTIRDLSGQRNPVFIFA